MVDTASDISSTPPSGCGPLLPSGRNPALPLRQDVFEFVRSHGQTARAEITQALDISAGSTTTLTADLISTGFLKEVESQTRESGRGRPRVALEIVRDAGFVIGIKLAFKRHTAVLVDFAGNVISSADLPSSDTRRTLDELLDEMGSLIKKILKTAKKTEADIKSVGIGMPGIVDHGSGVISWSSMLKTRDENLVEAFTERFGMPVVVDNDANMLTLAELWFGEGRDRSDFAVVRPP